MKIFCIKFFQSKLWYLAKGSHTSSYAIYVLLILVLVLVKMSIDYKF